MRSIRVLGMIVFALMATYYAFRGFAAQCSGASCDAYIPLSLLLPLLILMAGAVTGIVAMASARKGKPLWLALLATTTLIGVLGPVVLLILVRDQPDVLVAAATGLELLVPVGALVYTKFGGWTRSSAEGESLC